MRTGRKYRARDLFLFSAKRVRARVHAGARDLTHRPTAADRIRDIGRFHARIVSASRMSYCGDRAVAREIQ